MSVKNIISSFLTCFIAGVLLFSTGASAKKAPSVTDSEQDALGNTCRPDGKCTYYHTETLPGGITAKVEVVSLGAFKGDIDKIFEYAFGDVRRVAGLLNASDPTSEVSKVNANAGIGFVEVGPEFQLIMKAAKKTFLWTDGTFDITTTPDVGNFNNIKVAGNMVLLKRQGMRIGFDNIVHGFIADLLIRAIYNANVDNALAEVGPTSRSIGISVVGGWRTQVDDSSGGYARRGMTLDISNVSVGTVTAGVNAPTVDPRWAATPVIKMCRSVTIVSRNAAVSEALAHGIYIWGPEKGMMLINRLQNVRGVIVDNSGNFLKSPGI